MDRKNIFSFFFIEFKKTPKICNSRLEYRLKQSLTHTVVYS